MKTPAQKKLLNEMQDAVYAVLQKHKISFDYGMLSELLPDVTELLPSNEVKYTRRDLIEYRKLLPKTLVRDALMRDIKMYRESGCFVTLSPAVKKFLRVPFPKKA
jgi:hypothetical protein